MAIVRGLAILIGFYLLGEGVRTLLPWVPLTGSLWGMLLFFVALSVGALREAWVEQAANEILRLLGLLFVPVGVGILAYEALVVRYALALSVALVLSSVVTILVTGLAASWPKRSS
ncbi:MAG: CidA/LrgA family protein [Trueperaceae bacterium]|nr:CidA/LrgA family protein [Trueperaceae bacterium]